MRMKRQTVLGLKIERTEEELTAHGGLALLAQYSHGPGLRVGRHLPGVADRILWWSLVLMLQAGGRSLEDLRKLKGERALMKLIGREQVPDADRVGDWLRCMEILRMGRGGFWVWGGCAMRSMRAF